jgi:hypothetical protein
MFDDIVHSGKTIAGLLLAIAFGCISCGGDQQIPDDSFNPEIMHPMYSQAEGPVVLVDEAHENFHTIDNRYRPFAELLRRDGYDVKPARTELNNKQLDECRIFVISVPTSERNQSVYTDKEIRILKDWVGGGGSLLLITDHMPDPAAIARLADGFGIDVTNCYVLNEDPDEELGLVFFRRSDGTLSDHPVTNGRDGFDEQVDSVVSFTGCAFRASEDFIPLMTFGQQKIAWLTKEPDEFPPDTAQIDVEGWYQGGVMEYGKGRLAFFGEAGMFTAQIIVKPDIRFGMNVPFAEQNSQFLLNLFHWLSHDI